MTRILALFFLLFSLAACAPATGAKDAPASAPEKDEVVIVYQNSGGITGMSTTWTIYASGKVVNQDGQTFSASPDEVAALRDDLVTAGFSAQVKDLPRVKMCPDCTQSEVTLTVDGKPLTLSIVNEASDTPAAAHALVEQVANFIAQQKGQ